MDDQEIAQRIGELTDEQRNALYQLCEVRRNQPGADVAVYVAISAELAQNLYEKDLVWLLVGDRRQAAVRHDVYSYWTRYT